MHKTTLTKKEEPRSAQKRGLECEARVESFLRAKGFKTLAQRLKTPFAELDLIMQSPTGEVWMIEVKSCISPAWWQHRVGQRQKQRLLQALQFLTNTCSTPHHAVLAIVGPNDEVELIEDFL